MMRTGVYAHVLLRHDSYLRRTGWFKSFDQNLPVSNDGSPLPWFTYPAIQFLEPRIRRDFAVFEYGCGHSTLWWADRVSKIVSCEHDTSWYDKISDRVPAHVSLNLADLDSGQYSSFVGRFDETYDIVVIDGRDRVRCAKNALSALKGNGVVIWDNSDRPEYQEGYDLLANDGFKRLDFYGLGPIGTQAWCTSVFYREENCLQI